MRKNSTSIWSLIVLVVFFAVRYGFEAGLDRIGVFTSLIFEATFAIGVLWAFRRRWSWSFGPPGWLSLESVAAVLAGAGVFRFAIWRGYGVPFDFSYQLMLIMLFLVSPLVEETLYRGGLWLLLESVFKGRFAALIGTSVLFSLGHGYAYFSVPAEIKPFVLYQTIYTLGLGLWLGSALLRRKGFGSSIILHFFFNLGFYLAWRMG